MYIMNLLKNGKRDKRMDKFWSLALIFFLIGCITTDIIYIIIRFIKLIACRYKIDCKNRKCLVSDTCGKYDKSLTQEEYDYLTKLIEESFPERR